MRCAVLVLLFTAFLSSCIKRERLVFLQPYDNYPIEYTDSVSKAVTHTFGFKTITLSPQPHTKKNFVQIKSPRYRADSIIRDLKRNLPDSVDAILGLTNKDISTTKRKRNGMIKEPVSKYKDWGVFGLGYRPGKSCVVSTYRFETNNRKLFFSRLKKVSLHEIGHNLGLKHCPNHCLMKDAAETIKTIDSVPLALCKDCKKKI